MLRPVGHVTAGTGGAGGLHSGGTASHSQAVAEEGAREGRDRGQSVVTSVSGWIPREMAAVQA